MSILLSALTVLMYELMSQQVAWLGRFIQLAAKFLTVVPLIWKDEVFVRIEDEARCRYSKEWGMHVDKMISFAMTGNRRLGSGTLARDFDMHVIDMILRFVYNAFFKHHPHLLRRGIKAAIDTSPALAWAERKDFFGWMRYELRYDLAPYSRLERD